MSCTENFAEWEALGSGVGGRHVPCSSALASGPADICPLRLNKKMRLTNDDERIPKDNEKTESTS